MWHQKAFFSCRQSPSDLFWACWEASPLRPPFNCASRLLLLKNHQRIQDYQIQCPRRVQKSLCPAFTFFGPESNNHAGQRAGQVFQAGITWSGLSSHLNASLSNCMSRVYSFSFCLHTCQSYSTIPWQWFLIKAQVRVAPSSVTFWGNSLSAL